MPIFLLTLALAAFSAEAQSGNRIGTENFEDKEITIKLDTNNQALLEDVLAELQKHSTLTFKTSPGVFGQRYVVPKKDKAALIFDQLCANLGLSYYAAVGSGSVLLFGTREFSENTISCTSKTGPSVIAAFETAAVLDADVKAPRYDKESKKIVFTGPAEIGTLLKGFIAGMMESRKKELFHFRVENSPVQNKTLEQLFHGVATASGKEARSSIHITGIEEQLQKMLKDNGNTGSSIKADPNTNTIHVYDFPDRKEEYKSLIRSLDKEREMVEITAAIIDIRTTSDFEWESEFLAMGMERPTSRESFLAGHGADASFDEIGALPPASLANGAGLNTATMLVGSNYRIIQKLKALESSGEVRLLSQPSVLTIDNQPAQITDSSSQFVSVLGERTSNIFEIKAGLEMVILPRISKKENVASKEKPSSENKGIHLMVNIGDGVVEPNTGDADETPLDSAKIEAAKLVNRIATQALLRNGESLLIGGQYINSSDNREAGIPILKNIPLVGFAFKKKKVAERRFQRLYLITPRIVKWNALGEAENKVATQMIETAQRATERTSQPYLKTDNPADVPFQSAKPKTERKGLLRGLFSRKSRGK
jgi:type II secretory pathway component GspD/PulD (secretin)